jgi:hypothetical protein
VLKFVSDSIEEFPDQVKKNNMDISGPDADIRVFYQTSDGTVARLNSSDIDAENHSVGLPITISSSGMDKVKGSKKFLY